MIRSKKDYDLMACSRDIRRNLCMIEHDFNTLIDVDFPIEAYQLLMEMREVWMRLQEKCSTTS